MKLIRLLIFFSLSFELTLSSEPTWVEVFLATVESQEAKSMIDKAIMKFLFIFRYLIFKNS